MGARPNNSTPAEPWTEDDFRPVEAVIRTRAYGGNLSSQRLGLIRARLKERLIARGLVSFQDFHERHLLARTDGPGIQLLIDLTTVNHTTFFREPAPLVRLAEGLSSAIRVRNPGSGPIRVWSAGCSTGQEPYSLAMLLTEMVLGLGPDAVEIRATDIALEIVRSAARAMYTPRELGDVSPERLRRFFLRGRGTRQGRFRLSPEIRRLVTFQHFDLRAAAWPLPAEFDAVLCRNVAIYFAEAERLTLLDRMAQRLKPGGWLVIGNAEIVAERPGLLERVGPSIFRRVPPP